MKAGLPLTKHLLTPLTQRVLMPLGLTAVASATDAAIQKKMFGLGMTTLINIVLLAKPKLNSLAVLISEALINSYISHGEFV